MQPAHFGLLQGLLEPTYIAQAEQNANSFSKKITALLSHRKLPQEGWSDEQIEAFLRQVALLDANNAIGNVGVGEREGRVYSTLVHKRHFGLSHGVGRSGDLVAQQPKAAGSSMLAQLCKYLSLDVLRLSGFKNCKQCIVMPLATGMSLTMCFLALRRMPGNQNKKAVLWSRIDQKSCFKSIITSGLEPVIIELKPTANGDGLETDVESMQEAVNTIGAENILAIFCTTSTFAPRVPDDVVSVSQIAKKSNIALIINNAYGLQCSKIMQSIEIATRQGRVDAIIQSTDKNFMVPVGGAIIAAGSKESIDSKYLDKIAQCYPGRASGSSMLDLLITFLSLGQDGLLGLWKSRKETFDWYRSELSERMNKYGLRILDTKANKISICVDLTNILQYSRIRKQQVEENKGKAKKKASAEIAGVLKLEAEEVVAAASSQSKDGKKGDSGKKEDESISPDAVDVFFDKSQLKTQLNSLGAKLFNHRVSGPRVVACPAGNKTMDGFEFINYGAHGNDFPYPYLATAAAMGCCKEELMLFLERFEKALNEF